MNYPLLLTYIASIMLLIATPGPVVALVISDASRFGFRHAFRTVLGANLGSLLLIGSAALMISELLSVGDHWLRWVSLLGCLFIGWIAFKALCNGLNSGSASEEALVVPLPERPRYPVLKGCLVGTSNPKDIVFFVAFFPQFMGITPAPGVSLAILTGVWMLFDLLILLTYITIMKGDCFRRRARLMSILSAGFLLLIAVAGFGYSLLEMIGQA